MRSRRVPSAIASVPKSRGWYTPLSSWRVDVFINLEAFQTPHFGDFYGGFITRDDQSQTQSLAPFPFWGMGSGAESSKLLIIA